MLDGYSLDTNNNYATEFASNFIKLYDIYIYC